MAEPHISKDNLIRKTGVYVITHIPSGSRYVGSAARSFKHRWNGHKTDFSRGVHHSRWMQRIYNKYGLEVFRFDIVIVCRREDCLLYEQKVIDLYKPEFNTSPTAGSALGVKASKQRRDRLKKRWAERTEKFEVRGEMLTRKEIVATYQHVTYDMIQHRVRDGKRGEDLIAPAVENFPRSAIENGARISGAKSADRAQRFEINGKLYRAAEIAEMSGCSIATIKQRANAGWVGEELLRPPGEKAILNGSSGIKGVQWYKRTGKWVSYFQRKGLKRVTYHDTIEAAAAAYREAEEEYAQLI